MTISELLESIAKARHSVVVVDELLTHLRRHMPDDIGYVELAMPSTVGVEQATSLVVMESVYDDLLILRDRYENDFCALQLHEVKNAKQKTTHKARRP